MVDRIDPKLPTYSRVRETDPDEQQGGNAADYHQEEKSFFEEKTDWRLLYAQTPHRTKSKRLLSHDIDRILLQNISLKSDPSILEAIIVYKNQVNEGPVFISIPRSLALKLQFHQRGESLPKTDICPMPYLQIMVPELIPSYTVASPTQTARDRISNHLKYKFQWLCGIVKDSKLSHPLTWSWSDLFMLFAVSVFVAACVLLFLLYLY